MARETNQLAPPPPSLDPHVQQQIAQSGQSLEEQRSALAQTWARLRAVHQAAHGQRVQDQEAVRRENGQMQAALADRERELTEAQRRAEELHGHHQTAAAERDELRQRLDESEKHLAEARTDAARAAHLARLQQELTARSEAALREQRQELEGLIAELMQPGAAPASFAGAAIAMSCPDIELPEPAGAGQQPAELTALRELVATQAQEVEQLQERVVLLEGHLREKDEILERLRRGGPKSPTNGADDLATYEEELVAYHRQLEEERRQLDAQLRELEAHNEDLRERVHQAERELANRRASLDHLCARSRVDKAFVGVDIREKPVPVLHVDDPAAR